MKVLSLFDGMSCGMLALERAGIEVEEYYASEIDRFATKVSEQNYPEIIRLGDVAEIDYSKLPEIDLLIGGSPCQGFSFAGNRLNFDDERSKLFFEFVKALKKTRPKYFLLENVIMKKEFQDIISDHVGCEPIRINSALLSAQNRKRLYWTNIPGIEQPDDLNIKLEDIVQPESEIPEVMYYGEGSIEYMKRGNDKWQQAGNCRMERYMQTLEKEKSFTLTANMHKGVPYNFCDFSIGGAVRGRYIKDGKRQDGKMKVAGKTTQRLELRPDEKTNTLTTVQKDNVVVGKKRFRKLTPIECERLQTVPDNYTNHVSNTQRYKMLGNGWTVDVIAHMLKEIL